jgi:hypothetical protein
MWRECKENQNYSVSFSGRVKNKNGKVMNQYLDRYGYYYVSLGGKKYKVHRLVASAFIGDVGGKEVDHIDTNRKNNSLGNLRIVTRKENANNPRSILNLKKHASKYAKEYGKRVVGKDGTIYPSVIEAHRSTGIPRPTIQYHLKQHTGEWNYV